MRLNLNFCMLCLILTIVEYGNSKLRSNSDLVNELKNWIIDIKNNSTSLSCPKPYLKKFRNIQYLVKIVPCKQLGARNK